MITPTRALHVQTFVVDPATLVGSLCPYNQSIGMILGPVGCGKSTRKQFGSVITRGVTKKYRENVAKFGGVGYICDLVLFTGYAEATALSTW